LTVDQLTPQIAFLHGRGGNFLLFYGPDGSLLVHVDFAAAATEVATAVDRLGPGPVRHVINMHLHGDHTPLIPTFSWR
jgi:glyoxylase-like metal-dependent hydrolase (beta-lactamase superfamily II)